MPDSPYFPTLEVNLAAIARNYTLVREQLTLSSCETPKAAAQDLTRSRALPSGQPRDDVKKRCGAVVKANAYGLGAAKVVPALYGAGCRDFFVATLGEGTELRAALLASSSPTGGGRGGGLIRNALPHAPHLASPLRGEEPEARIYVFHGARSGQARDFLAHQLIPVLNSAEQVKDWADAGPWGLHIDTGMNRLGVSPSEAANLPATGNLQLVMSHLACASDMDHPKNREQFDLFRQVLRHFPGIPASFANSSGVFLSPDYHFDLVRPGRALYGITRGTKMPANLENVVTLSAPVLQYRTADSSGTVGYGATTDVEKDAVLATVEMGYADGLMRSLSHKLHGFAAGVRVPVIGLISMDMIVVDVTSVPAHLRTPELRITLIGEEQPIDMVADAAGTIGYEIFTRLGSRVRKIYS